MRLTVRVTRADGSVTFKGWYRDRLAPAERERDAWLAEGRAAVIVDADDPTTAAELKAWKRATTPAGGRWFPPDPPTYSSAGAELLKTVTAGLPAVWTPEAGWSA